MPHYYFDYRDGEVFTPDDLGIDLRDDKAARDQAARALADAAKDILPGGARRTLSVVVRDESKRPLLVAKLVFEIAFLR